MCSLMVNGAKVTWKKASIENLLALQNKERIKK